MRIAIINVCAGCYSTGKIASSIANEYKQSGYQCVIAYGQTNKEEHIPTYKIGNKLDLYGHVIKARIFDTAGFESKKATKRLLSYLDEFNPDILWLHNLHGYYINVELLFCWIKEHPNLDVKWTMHDCWAFTGHCSYFTAAKCDKWKTGCNKCVQKTSYPASWFLDSSSHNYERKKLAFKGVKNMTIITPSEWMAGLVKQSFLGEYCIIVQNNKVNTDVFHERSSNFRDKHGIQNKKMVLGVASPWSERKGLNDFIEMSRMLPDDYIIVLVGLTKKQIRFLPLNIIGIAKTNSAIELAEIYSSANVFVNPTYEDNYPTTNLEATACGTPVITYKTGGSPESVLPENVVEVGDISGLVTRIKRICEEDCKKRRF